MAAGRADRPVDFEDEPGDCPFCPGNESMTPPEICRLGEPWQVRVFPNKYPASDHHEVIVDSPVHGIGLADLTQDQLALATGAWGARVRALYGLAGVRYVSAFHNHGLTAGASRRHLHTQLIGLDFIPEAIVQEQDFVSSHPGHACDIVEKGFVFRENRSVLGLCPAVPAFSYEAWILPKEPGPMLPQDTRDFAEILGATLRAMNALLGRPDYNIMLKAMPRDWCWRAEIVPRTGYLAGFELDTACHIVSILPERAAAELAEILSKTT